MKTPRTQHNHPALATTCFLASLVAGASILAVQTGGRTPSGPTAAPESAAIPSFLAIAGIVLAGLLAGILLAKGSARAPIPLLLVGAALAVFTPFGTALAVALLVLSILSYLVLRTNPASGDQEPAGPPDMVDVR